MNIFPGLPTSGHPYVAGTGTLGGGVFGDLIAREGESATLSVIGSGGVTLMYQWYQGASGETNLPAMGGTNATFTTPPLTTNSTFWVRVSSSAGETNSASATVTVFPPKTAWLDMRKVDGLPAVWIDGALDTPYRVQISTGLDVWTDLIDLSLLTSPFLFIDPDVGGSPFRFYRLLILPDGG